MQRTSIGWVVLVSLGFAALVGCAVGSDAEYGESDLTTLPVEAGGDENSVMLPPSQKPIEEDDAGADTDAGDLDAGKKPDAAPDAGPPVSPACASPNTCAAATNLGEISGDTGNGSKTASGSGSQWFKVRVTEDNNDLVGTSVAVKAELTSPAGTNFDLFVYVAGSVSGQECSAVAKSSTSTGASDTASHQWGEGLVPNGSSDSRDVTVEVRHKSGTCAPAAKWTLTVRGNVL